MHIVANYLSILEGLCRINLLFGCSLNKGKIPVKWPEKRIRVPPAKTLKDSVRIRFSAFLEV
jgi:hypothetical protein